MKGYIHIYTGNGKGKTTAALGLALRAAGAGLKIYIAQFIKSGDYSEIIALGAFSDRITIKQFGHGRFIKGKPSAEDVLEARRGLKQICKILCGNEYDLVILDEANIAVATQLFSENDLLEIMQAKPVGLELIITGRGATDRVIERADLVTEMKEIKHYYHAGVKARTGIEK